MNLQQRIAQILLAQATAQEHPLKSLIEGQTINQICHTIFHSYRGNTQGARGLRLSDLGLQLMKTFFKSHEVKLVGGYEVTLPHLLYLDRVSTMPYWLNDDHMCTFDSDLAMMLVLGDGCIQNLIDTRYRLVSSGDSLNADI